MTSAGSLRAGEPAPAALGAAAWRPWTVGVAVVGAAVLALAGRAVVATGAGDGTGALLGVGVALVVCAVATVGLAIGLATTHGRPDAADFGLCRSPIGRAIWLGLAVWIGFTVATVLWAAALGLDGEGGQALTDRLGTDGTLAVVILVVVVTILAPIEEELLFRGYIFRALRNRSGVWPAAVTAGVLFAATHIGWVSLGLMVPVVLFGVGLCLLYEWTGSLYPGIALHALNNALPLGLALHWTWQTPLLMAGTALAAVTIARLIALRLGDREALSGAA